MKFVSVLALAGLATYGESVKIPHTPGTPYISQTYECYDGIPDWHGCNLDKTMTQCTDGVGTVYECIGGCLWKCVDKNPCTPICNEPYNGDTWKYVDDGNFYHQPGS